MKSLLVKGAGKNGMGFWNIQKVRSLMAGSKNINAKVKTSSKLQIEKRNYENMMSLVNYRQTHKHSDFFSTHHSPNVKNNKASIYLLGNAGQIYGFNEDDYTSNDVLLNQVEAKSPNALILGNMNYTDMMYMRIGDLKYDTKPKIELVQAEQIIARKKMSKFLNEEMLQTGRYFNEYEEEKEDYTIYELDKELKRQIVRPQLAIAKYACTTQGKKLFFGQPNQLLVLEELASKLSLSELREIFSHCIQSYYDLMKQDIVACIEHPIDVHHNLQNIAMNLYDQSLYKDQITYQASLLRKCTKLYKETVMVVNDLMVDKIKNAAMNPEIKEFDEVFNRQFPEKQNVDEMLEKMSILTHLFSREFQLYLDFNQERGLMSEMWNGMYSDEVGIQQRFYKANEKYREKLQQLFNHDVKRLKEMPASGRTLIETYDDAIKRFDLKLKRQYRFVANPQRENIQLMFLFQKLWMKVQDNINKREAEGINQEQTRVMLSSLSSDKASSQALNLYRELIIEANTQLGFFTLPEEVFGKYKELIKITTYDLMKRQLGGEDPRKEYKRQVISEQNQNSRMVYTQLQDGTVPSFAEFSSIKDQIIKSNSNQQAGLSPLKRQELIQETTSQYMKLEQMLQEHPGAKDRIKKVQGQLNQDYLPLELRKHNAVFIDRTGNPVSEENMIPENNAVYSPTGESLPFDITNKTVNELKKMGFKEVMSMNMQKDPSTKTLRPNLNSEEKMRMRNILKEMEDDEKDPDYYLDTMGDPVNENEQSAKERKLDELILRQKKIDDAKIALIHKALEKGIPLKDELYLELLDFYPYYQKILANKQNQIKMIKKEQERIIRGDKPILYKFEKQIKGRANLSPQRNVVDVETVTDEKQKEEDDMAYYEQILKQYEHDLEEIKVMGSSIEKDVITEEFAIQDIKENEREEQEIERKLGNKYLTNIDDEEAGSTLGSVNEKHRESLMMEQFFKDNKDMLSGDEKSNKKNVKQDLDSFDDLESMNTKY